MRRRPLDNKFSYRLYHPVTVDLYRNTDAFFDRLTMLILKLDRAICWTFDRLDKLPDIMPKKERKPFGFYELRNGHVVKAASLRRSGTFVWKDTPDGKHFVFTKENSRPPKHYGMSDTLGEGVKGVFNPADGQRYDSKSAYYQAVEDAGCTVVGNDPVKPNAPQLDEIDWDNAIAEAIEMTGFCNQPKKGKKKR